MTKSSNDTFSEDLPIIRQYRIVLIMMKESYLRNSWSKNFTLLLSHQKQEESLPMTDTLSGGGRAHRVCTIQQC